MKQVLGRSPLAPAGLLGAMLLILGTAGMAMAQTPDKGESEPPENVGADTGLPVTVEDAFVPSPGETEAQLHFFYDHQRSKVDEDKRFGHHLFTPEAEVEVGVAKGLSATLQANYSLGNAEEAKSGEAEAEVKWNFFQLRDLGPALSLSGAVSVPYGYST